MRGGIAVCGVCENGPPCLVRAPILRWESASDNIK